MSGIRKILDRSEAILAGEDVASREWAFTSYAVSNFRGGIGKSTLAFNIAHEISRHDRVLLLDTCSQRNFTQNILGDDVFDAEPTIYDALVNAVTGDDLPEATELAVPVSPYCASFKGGKKTYLVPGSTQLFLFPSLLYGQLAQFSQLQGKQKKRASKRILLSLKRIIKHVSDYASPAKILIDTSPFFGGATHLAWEAAQAIIIPVRVDQHSLEALRLTLEMLTNEDSDFHRFNLQAGIEHQPYVHAVVMTHCGWNRQRANNPDSSTRYFVEKALEIAEEFYNVFSEDDPADCFYLLDDFHSSGRISGKQRIPLSKLKAGTKYVVDGKRLEVNPSVDRYKREVANLTAAL